MSTRVTTYKVPNQAAVDKLQRADHDKKRHETVEQLHPLRRLVDVFAPHAVHDLVGIDVSAFGA